MRVLAFDTALGACSAAVLIVEDGRRSLARAYEVRARGHAEALMPMIGSVMTEAGLSFGELDRFAVTTGPGTFTGCRIGVAAARGLALVAGHPIVAATTLAVMDRTARAMRSDLAGDVLTVAVDARRGQVYAAAYGPDGAAIADVALLAVADAAARVPEGAVAVGSAAPLLAEAARLRGRRIRAELTDLEPDAGALAEMALTRAPETGSVRPLYLRPPDAKPQATPAVALAPDRR